jgi:hypothetical protein
MNNEQRPHERSATIPAFGRSYCYITCPFCNTEAKTFIWSLAGGGKRCPGCKAMHTHWGMTIAKDGDTPQNNSGIRLDGDVSPSYKESVGRNDTTNLETNDERSEPEDWRPGGGDAGNREVEARRGRDARDGGRGGPLPAVPERVESPVRWTAVRGRPGQHRLRACQGCVNQR